VSDAVGGFRQRERSRFAVAAWYRPALARGAYAPPATVGAVEVSG